MSLQSLFMNTTKFVYSKVLDYTWPMFGTYEQIRPIILLPFNIWFFFVSLPFRFFFFFMNGFTSRLLPTKKSLELKDKTVIVDLNEKTIVVPAITVSKASPPQIRQRKVVAEERPFSWYTTTTVVQAEPVTAAVAKTESILQEFASQLEEIKLKKEEVMPEMPEEIKVDESAELKVRIAEFEQREKDAMEEKQRLEAEFEELTSKFDDDEKALASFEEDRIRFKTSIAAEQKKRFDAQQDLIALKNQLRAEQESRLRMEEELRSMKKSAETKAAKESSSQTDVVAVPKAIVSEAPKAVETETKAPKSVWNIPHHEHDYTEMVAAAQEELSHKTGVEVVKESIAIPEEKEVAPVEEFVVVGGDQSNQHIVENVVPEIEEVAVESKEVVESEKAVDSEETVKSEAPKSAWNIPHHEHDYTEMVGAAAKEELAHKSGVEVVKESLAVPEEKVVDAVEEFTVVGGDLSTKHVLLNSSPEFATTN